MKSTRQNLILVGGIFHDFQASAEALAMILAPLGIESRIEADLDAGIASERIVLAGFSQGGAVVYHTALAYPKPLGGLLTLSTYFPAAEEVQLSAANKSLPIHIFRGTQDPMVVEAMGHAAKQTLQGMGFRPEYRCYPMQHEVCGEEIVDIGNSLKAWLQLS